MSILNGMPVVFNDEDDIGLLGSLFPEGASSSGFTSGLSNQNSYKSPFAELSRPKDGSLIKTDDPVSVFENDYSYTIDVKVYDNGYEIINAYDKTTVKERDIIFFCEKTNPNKSNLFKTFVLVKYGSKYRELLYDLKNGKTAPIASHRKNSNVSKIIKTFDDEVTDNFSILTKEFSVDIEESKVKSIMSNELYATSSSAKTVKDLYEWYNNGISTAVNGVNGWLEGMKFTEKDYIPQNKPMLSEALKEALDAAKKGADYLVPDAIEDFVSNSFDSALSQIKNFIKDSLPQSWVLFLKKVYNTIQGMLNIFKEGIAKMADFTGEAFLLFKALLMGVANGLLSTVQTLLSAIGWLLEKNSYKIITGEFQKELQGKLEFIEDLFDLISEKAADFFNGVRSLINDFSLDKIKDVLGVFGNKVKDLTKYDYAYFAGSFVFEVILGVVLAYFTGGATAVAEAANLAEKVTAMLRLVAREVISTATMGAIDILQLFKVLIAKFVQACKNGWKGFKAFLESILANKADDIAKEDGKILDEVEGNTHGGKSSKPVKMVTGKYSKRLFNPENAGGPILNLKWKNAKISRDGLEIIKKHLSRLDADDWNERMIERLEKIINRELEVSDFDKRFYTHETREFERYKALGHENSLQYEIPDEVWDNAHAATLEDFKLHEKMTYDDKEIYSLYHPDVQY